MIDSFRFRGVIFCPGARGDEQWARPKASDPGSRPLDEKLLLCRLGGAMGYPSKIILSKGSMSQHKNQLWGSLGYSGFEQTNLLQQDLRVSATAHQYGTRQESKSAKTP